MDNYAEFMKEYETYNLGSYEISKRGIQRDNALICPQAILPVCIMENADTGVEKVELAYYKRGRWRRLIVPRSTISAQNSIVKLADNGIEVTQESSKLLVRYLSDIIALNQDRIKNQVCKSYMGWTEDKGFMPYVKSVAFDGEEDYRSLYTALHSRGTLDEWAKFVAPLRENIDLRLIMAAAFASPLIEVVGENAFVLHLWGGTGTGKSVALLVSMSIWGDPNFGALTRTMNMTQNSMLSCASFLRNLPFAGDELQTIKSQFADYDKLIMCVTEGIDRARMWGGKLQPTRTWKCSFIFTGEEPCVKQTSGGGVKNRVIEIECKGQVVAEGNKVATFVKTHYGCAGEEYINAVKQADVQPMYDANVSAILDACDTTDKQAGAMALLMCGDEIARAFLWPSEAPLCVSDVREYLRSANEVDAAERAYQYLVNAIAQNVPKFNNTDKAVWGKIDDDVCYINRNVLDEMLTAAGFDLAACKRKWVQKGYVIPNSQGRYTHCTTVNGAKASYLKLQLPEDDIPQEKLPF